MILVAVSGMAEIIGLVAFVFLRSYICAAMQIPHISVDGPCSVRNVGGEVCFRSSVETQGQYPEPYVGGAFCAFHNMPDLPITTKHFMTTSKAEAQWCKIFNTAQYQSIYDKCKDYDFLSIQKPCNSGDGSRYFFAGDTGPQGVVPVKGSTMTFYAGSNADGCAIAKAASTGNEANIGFEICVQGQMAPAPVPPPAIVQEIGTIGVHGYCTIFRNETNVCLRSPNFPNMYPKGHWCKFTNLPALPIKASKFELLSFYGESTVTIDTMPCYERRTYSGKTAPHKVIPVENSAIEFQTSTFSADSILDDIGYKGFELCFENVRMTDPPPAQIGHISVTGPCRVEAIDDLVCMRSGNFTPYPSCGQCSGDAGNRAPYPYGQNCRFDNVPNLKIIQRQLDTIIVHDELVFGDKNVGPFDNWYVPDPLADTYPSTGSATTSMYWTPERKGLQKGFSASSKYRGFDLCFRAHMPSTCVTKSTTPGPEVDLVEAADKMTVTNAANCSITKLSSTKVCLEINGTEPCDFTNVPNLTLTVELFDVCEHAYLQIRRDEDEHIMWDWQLPKYYMPAGPKNVKPKQGSTIEYFVESHRRDECEAEKAQPVWQGIRVCFSTAPTVVEECTWPILPTPRPPPPPAPNPFPSGWQLPLPQQNTSENASQNTSQNITQYVERVISALNRTGTVVDGAQNTFPHLFVACALMAYAFFLPLLGNSFPH